MSPSIPRATVLAALFTMLLAHGTAAQSAPVDSATTFPRIDQLLRSDIAVQRIPGTAVTFVNSGRVVYARGVGVANVETGRPVTASTLFRVGSVSKPVSAYAVIAEARARGIPLDAPIGRYMPGLTPKLGRVSLHQLLSHTAGIREEITAYPIADRPDERELVGQLSTWTDTMFFAEPGDVESYSNLGFVLAGAFIERVAGKPFEQIVADRLWKPLGVTDATYSSRAAVTHPYADGYTGPRGSEPRLVRPIVTDARHLPPTMLWASALDLARFEIALMNHGRIDGRQVLDSAVVALMLQPQARIPAARDSWYGYGLQVQLDGRGLVHRVFHGGHIEGYFAGFDMAPVRGRGFVMLTNRLDEYPRQAIRALLAAELGDSTLAPEPAASPVARSWTAHDIVGHYANGSWSFDVVDSAGVLLFRGKSSPTSAQGQVRRVVPLAGDLLELQGSRGTAPIPAAVVRGQSGAIYLYVSERAARKRG